MVTNIQWSNDFSKARLKQILKEIMKVETLEQEYKHSIKCRIRPKTQGVLFHTKTLKKTLILHCLCFLHCCNFIFCEPNIDIFMHFIWSAVYFEHVAIMNRWWNELTSNLSNPKPSSSNVDRINLHSQSHPDFMFIKIFFLDKHELDFCINVP